MYRGGREGILRQMDQVWSILDDLAENDPKAYQKFIEKQMEGENLKTPPELICCLRTEIMGPNKGLLYINICGWKRVPGPPNPGKPIPMFGGILETHKDKDGDEYHVLDVAVSPTVLQEAKQDTREMEQVYLLVLSFAQQQHGLQLSQQYTVTNSGLQANLEDVYHRLGFQQHLSRSPVSTSQPESVPQTPAALLKQFSSPPMKDSPSESTIQLTVAAVEQKNNNLIQVLSSTYRHTLPQRPEYQLKVNTDTGELSHSVKLTVALPMVRSISQCQLSISQEDVLLVVEDLYHLLLELPILVNEDNATATFSRKTRMLTLTVAAL